MIKINDLINEIKNYNYIFVNKNLKINIRETVEELFPNLSNEDSNILYIFSLYLIEDISIRFNFTNEEKYIYQWLQNNKRDIKSIILMLLPYINDKNNNYKKITDLNQILCNIDDNKIPNYFLTIKRSEMLKNLFPFSNFSLGLMDNNNNDLLNLYENNEKLIYHNLHHNFVSILETLYIMNGKLYVNWINITPISHLEYKKSKIYLKTRSKLDLWLSSYSNDNKHDNFLKNYKGLYLGDYYNVFRNCYYKSIKKIKWVLYNKKIKNKNIKNDGIYMIQYIDKLINLTPVYKYDFYEDLNSNEKYLFENKFKSFMLNLSNKTVTLYDFNFEKSLISTFLTFMINNFSKKYILLSKNKSIKTFVIKNFDDEGEDIDKSDKIIKNINISDIINCFNNIDIKYIWEYLKETVNILKNTIYYKFLITKDYYYYDDNKNINLKNIYNISKSLSHTTVIERRGKIWRLLPENYKSLSLEQIKEFWKKLHKNDKKWLNLNNNLKLQEGNDNINSVYSGIFRTFTTKNKNEYLWDKLVWECLTENGLISEFNVNLDLTDEKQLPLLEKPKAKKIHSILKKNISKKRDYYDKCKYYLTNDSYENLKLRWEKGKENEYEFISYLDYLTHKEGGQVWYTYYAMDWISQINFFNHFINHQILFVTGSTGTGKSTQVPKLLLYAKKVYDYNFNGNVICTQPRIPPTESNIDWISKQMGVPIAYSSKTIKERKTNNFYLQFKHSEKKHTNNNNYNLQLRMVTDGTLLQEILNNPIMKEEISTGINKINDEGKRDTIYTKNNKWDILVVDEAHEHNTNMDIILTLSRQVCFYNNSVRLVIISATMDDDEPTYRSYFKYINDNLLYPLKRSLNFHPVMKGYNNFMIYSNYLDRRFHISAPGQTTLHKITEIYDENIQYKLTDNNKLNSEIVQENAILKINEICKISKYGQVLLFSTGSKEIINAVEQLNKILPQGAVALPYFANMATQYKDIVQNIGNKIKFIKNKKINIFQEWGPKFIEDKSVHDGIYKRAVIVATNVAEASITIDGLKFVVDNGYAKVNQYDEENDVSELLVEKISEASRLQRKGRVGRTSSGTVYYMYGKNERENVMPKYKITQENNQNLYLNLLTNNKDNLIPSQNFLWPKNFHYYTYFNFPSNYKQDYNNEKFKKTYLYKKKIFENMKHQILLDDKHLPYEFYESSKLYQKDFPYFFNRNIDGYEWDILQDLFCKFFIVHPYENNIERNINNDIISYNYKNINIIYNELSKLFYYNFLLKMQAKMFFLNNKGLMIKDTINNKKIRFKKTLLVNRIQSLSSDLKISENIAYTLLVGQAYNILTEVVEIIVMLNTINYKIHLLVPENKYFDDLYNFYGNKESDLVAIYLIIKKIKDKFKNLLIFDLLDLNSKLLKKNKKIYERLVEEFEKYSTRIDPPKNLKNVFNLLNSLKINGRLKNNSGFLTWFYSSEIVTQIILSDLNKNLSKIMNWCDNNCLNKNIIRNYFFNYINFLKNFMTIKKNYDLDVDEETSLEWIKKISFSKKKSISINDKIIKSFLIGNSFNVGIKRKKSFDKFWLVNGKHFDVIKLARGTPYQKNSTLCSPLGSIIFYLNISKNSYKKVTELTIITKIKPEILSKTIPLYYNKLNFSKIYLKHYLKSKDISYKIYRYEGKLFDDLIRNIINNWSLNEFIWYSKDLPIIKEYVDNVKSQLL
jgi:hypothetical protein